VRVKVEVRRALRCVRFEEVKIISEEEGEVELW